MGAQQAGVPWVRSRQSMDGDPNVAPLRAHTCFVNTARGAAPLADEIKVDRHWRALHNPGFHPQALELYVPESAGDGGVPHLSRAEGLQHLRSHAPHIRDCWC
jgi:hypothetical protein